MEVHRLQDLAQGKYVDDWLVLGPFVVRTGDDFEREYMYERERILDIDYLEADGGEVALAPEPGRSYANIGLGPKRLTWREFPHEYLDGMYLAGELIYETVQRNCVLYAAAWIDSDVACDALLDAYHSGMKIWMNGEVVCNAPYGFPKGVRLAMAPVPVRLRAGRNLLMVKFRPGFICDGVDFGVRRLTVSPLAAKAAMPVSFGRVRAINCFRGTPEARRQVIEAYLWNATDAAQACRVTVSNEYGSDVLEATAPARSATPVRLSLPAPRDKAGTRIAATCRLECNGQSVAAPLQYESAVAPKYDGTNYILTAFHFDTTYHEEQRVYAMGAFDIVRQYCRLHAEDPRFRSIISEVDYLKPYFDVYPEDRATLLRVFRERLSEPDVMYNQPNEQNCGDEALVRNFLYGQLIHGRMLGNVCHVYDPGDVFGHPNQLSQIARKSGCIGVAWGKYIFNFPPFFDHLSLDGVAIPHQRGRASEDDVHAMGLSVNLGETNQTPPTDWHETLMPLYKQGTFGDAFSAILRECDEKGAHLPVTSRDMSLYHAATALSRLDLKIANRLAENILLDAEKFATIATLLGARYPEKAVDKAWRQLLCGQHHDSITGTHNEISFVDLVNSYREALELAVDVRDRAQAYLGSAVAAPDKGQPLVVFNSLAWTRTDVVRTRVNGPRDGFAILDARGKNVPYDVLSVDADGASEIAFVAVDLPSLGYRTYQIAPKKQKPPVRECAAGDRDRKRVLQY